MKFFSLVFDRPENGGLRTVSSMGCICFLSQHKFKVMAIHKSKSDASHLFNDF